MDDLETELTQTLRSVASGISGEPPSTHQAGPRTLVRAGTIFLAFAIAFGAFALVFVSLRDTQGRTPRQPAGSATKVNPPSLELGRSVHLPGSVESISADQGTIWVGTQGNDGDQSGVVRVDEDTGDASLVPLPGPLVGAIADGTSVWGTTYSGTSSPYEPTLWHIFANGAMQDVDGIGGVILPDDGGVWTTQRDGGIQLVHVDAATLDIDRVLPLPQSVHDGLLTENVAWLTTTSGHEILRVDLTSGSVTTYLESEDDELITNLVGDGMTGWAGEIAMREGPNKLVRLGSPQPIETSPEFVGPALSSEGDLVWLMSEDGELAQIDGLTGETLVRFTTGEVPAEGSVQPTATFDQATDSIWIGGDAHRIQGVTVSP